MDSQFINYDGRSVHDMIQLLLTASGDPEAIRALQESIAAVDAKFTPVNAELERLEDGKQDVGDYTENGGAPGYAAFKFSESAHVMDMRRSNNQYSNGISFMGVNSEPDPDGVSREWFRYERNSEQLQAYIYKSENGATPTWQTANIWTADKDTGWQSLSLNEGVTGELKGRIKNGIVELILTNVSFVASAANLNAFATIPGDFRPQAQFFTPCGYVVGTSSPEPFTGFLTVNTTGVVQFRPKEVTNTPVRIYSQTIYTI